MLGHDLARTFEKDTLALNGGSAHSPGILFIFLI